MNFNKKLLFSRRMYRIRKHTQIMLAQSTCSVSNMASGGSTVGPSCMNISFIMQELQINRDISPVQEIMCKVSPKQRYSTILFYCDAFFYSTNHLEEVLPWTKEKFLSMKVHSVQSIRI
jgi:hypothetical protein